MAAGPQPMELEIIELGAQGDGIALSAGRRLFVPYALPGERVVAVPVDGRDRLALQAILRPAADRWPAACRHFGPGNASRGCGGCALQHLAPAAYRCWKREVVAAALAHRGFRDPPVAPVIPVAPGGRRRIRLSVARTPAGTVVGFRARASERIVSIEECPVADARLVSLALALPDLAVAASAAQPTAFELTLTEAGSDLVAIGRNRLDRDERERAARFAATHDLARLSWAVGPGSAEPIVTHRAPHVRFGHAAVQLPPGAFVQASAAAEAALAGEVLRALDAAEVRRVLDLYAGIGTFALRIAATRRCHAVEGHEAMAATLRQAGADNGLAGRLSVDQRDLARRPLQPVELNAWDAVVFDPPEAGAAPQARALAASTVPTILAISCAPATFARDARTLAEGGYRLVQVQPIDQFLWSPRVELAALFRR